MYTMYCMIVHNVAFFIKNVQTCVALILNKLQSIVWFSLRPASRYSTYNAKPVSIVIPTLSLSL